MCIQQCHQLSDLKKKSAPNNICWNAKCDEAFKELKELLYTSPVLRNPDFVKLFILQTDASERGVGAVLSQTDETGEEHPIAYFSKKRLPREERYSTVEKECLAIKLAIQAFWVYLLERRFTIQTDHRLALQARREQCTLDQVEHRITTIQLCR